MLDYNYDKINLLISLVNSKIDSIRDKIVLIIKTFYS